MHVGKGKELDSLNEFRSRKNWVDDNYVSYRGHTMQNTLQEVEGDKNDECSPQRGALYLERWKSHREKGLTEA